MESELINLTAAKLLRYTIGKLETKQRNYYLKLKN